MRRGAFLSYAADCARVRNDTNDCAQGCPSMQFFRDRRVQFVALVLALAGAGVAVYWWTHRTVLPGRESREYQEYQRKFQVGTAGLETGREDIARANLDRAIELIPDEPAAWANRGLLNLRTNNLPDAAKDLKRAHQLAPESSEIEGLLGLLA